MIATATLYGAAGFAALALLVYLVVALLRAEDL
ncbi:MULTISPECIES: potassium-transporting ATPase subunit F [Xylophilus]|jgi:K+-transporting ATPase KdpF subunit|uniref:K+-transporting ATPase KdpF subunit n=1 Tax=Xylophilus ampelinus TaxID=54067 RepID=A0A318SJ95_9BURK|nr:MULTISPECIES: potassium-transporting ATPase subunit F [Xylophilus]MCS4509563.1 potassium-transporting ATPase subunit F [Xylophilus ampelinus]PYE78956.1 K+-transporting ATPase KdpF subunit [Xylophilus ampelinus]